MKKKLLSILFAGLMVFLVACSGQDQEQVSFYNWGGTLNDEVLLMFEEETGIKVVYSEFDQNENMYTIVKNAPKDYDLIVPSDYMVEKMINEGMLAEIDLSKLENYDEIDDAFKNTEYDPENKYSVPMFYGTVGILYNKTMVDEADLNQWDAIFNDKYAGQIYMLDSSRDTMGVGYWHLGYSANSSDPQELQEVEDLMKSQKSLVKAYLQDQIKQHMVNEEGALGVVYAGEAREAMEENPDLAYYLPLKSNLWIDAFAIPKDAPNYENALKLIDFLSRPDIAAMSGDIQGTVVTKSRDLEPVKSIDNFEVIYPDLDEMDDKEIYKDLGDFIDQFESSWEEVKNH